MSDNLPCFPLPRHHPLWDFRFPFASECKLFSLSPNQKSNKIKKILANVNISLTCMAGPRGAGRLGVAAEGGAKPVVGLFLLKGLAPFAKLIGLSF